MAAPLAFFITFRCYGTWLHGDVRGSVDQQHRTVGQEPLPRDDFRATFEREEMRWPPMTLTPEQRLLVASAIEEACAFRGWSLLALNVRTNHVHAVVAAESGPEKVMTDFKAWATRKLRQAGAVEPGRRPWSRHGSTRWLWTEQDVRDAQEYTVEGQDRRD